MRDDLGDRNDPENSDDDGPECDHPPPSAMHVLHGSYEVGESDDTRR